MKNKNFINKKFNSILKMIGLILIFYAAIIFDENTYYPSFYSLIPVIGTSLIILGIQTDDFINKILVNKFIVFNGLLSYSLYIFHQPIFSGVRFGFHLPRCRYTESDPDPSTFKPLYRKVLNHRLFQVCRFQICRFLSDLGRLVSDRGPMAATLSH